MLVKMIVIKKSLCTMIEPNTISGDITLHARWQVAPDAPILDKNVLCENDFKVIIPDGEDEFTYSKSVNGSIVTITAIPTDGHILNEGVETTWTFDVNNPEKCSVTPLGTGKPEITNPESNGPTGELKPLLKTGSQALSIAMIALFGVGAIGFIAYRRILNNN